MMGAINNVDLFINMRLDSWSGEWLCNAICNALFGRPQPKIITICHSAEFRIQFHSIWKLSIFEFRFLAQLLQMDAFCLWQSHCTPTPNSVIDNFEIIFLVDNRINLFFLFFLSQWAIRNDDDDISVYCAALTCCRILNSIKIQSIYLARFVVALQ